MKPSPLCVLVLAVLACSQSTSSSPNDTTGEAGARSPLGPATTADVDAMFKAWCDWSVRCSSDYPVENCTQRRANCKKPEVYAAGPMADMAACFATLSCEAYDDGCVRPVAMALAQSTPSRADFLGSCSSRANECTDEGHLSLLTCYWLTLFADPALAKAQACVAKPCDQNMSCIYALDM